jgi:hypothetical protein
MGPRVKGIRRAGSHSHKRVANERERESNKPEKEGVSGSNHWMRQLFRSRLGAESCKPVSGEPS